MSIPVIKSTELLYQDTLALCVTNPRAYSEVKLQYAIGECDVILKDHGCGPATKLFAQEQKTAFVEEIARRVALGAGYGKQQRAKQEQLLADLAVMRQQGFLRQSLTDGQTAGPQGWANYRAWQNRPQRP